MKQYPLVAILLAIHNNKEDTREFLENLKSITYPDYVVIVTDDGSTDGTEEMIKREYPEVLVLKGDGNFWWTRSTNIGIEKAIEIGAKYVLLGENDHRVSVDFLSALVDTAENNARSITFSKVLDYSRQERIYCAGWKINWLKGGLCRIGAGEVDKGQYDVRYDSKAANVNMLINTAFFKDLGMFDQKSFPQYWADTDFTYRAYKKGYRIIYEPSSIIWNKGHATVGSDKPQTGSPLTAFIYFARDIRSSRNFRDTAIFCWKHYPKLVIPYILVQHTFRLVLSSLVISARHIIRRLRRRMSRDSS